MCSTGSASVKCPPVQTQMLEATSAKEILAQAYSERVDSGLMQYKVTFGKLVDNRRQKEPEEWVTVCCKECETPDHMLTLRDGVYVASCKQQRVKANSGVLSWFSGSDRCICLQEGGSFNNLLLGNRGILSVLPLLECMKALKHLSLNGNGLRDAGIRAVVSTLSGEEALPQLCVLDLSHNPLSMASADQIEPVIESRERLLLLGLTGTSLSGGQRQQLMSKALTNFENAAPDEALEAWRLAASAGFADQAWYSAHAKALQNSPTAQLGRPVPPPRPPSGTVRPPRRKEGFVRKEIGCSSNGLHENCNACSRSEYEAASRATLCA